MDEGSTFWFELPVAYADAGPPPTDVRKPEEKTHEENPDRRR
jgi:hypothetical protein